MLRHRGLSLGRFVKAIPPDLLERYVARLARSTPQDGNLPQGWELLNGNALTHFLNTNENAEVAGIILEDFQRCGTGPHPNSARDLRAYGSFLARRTGEHNELPTSPRGCPGL